MNTIYQSLKLFFLDNPNSQFSFKEITNNIHFKKINHVTLRVTMSTLAREQFIKPVWPRKWELRG